MMILYIHKRSTRDVGTATHKKALIDIYGNKNVFEVDLLNKEVKRTDLYVSYGYNVKDIKQRVVRYLQGNIPSINNKIIDDVCRIIEEKKVKLVFAEESDLGNLYKTIKKKFPEVFIICFYHDISADLFRIRIHDTPKWKRHYIMECKRVISQENLCQRYVDENWAFHQQDSDRFNYYYGHRPDVLIPIASFVPEKVPVDDSVTDEHKIKNILFVCSRYYVNIDGFRWFHQNVIPGLIGNYMITVVGDGSGQLKGLESDKLKILGRVESMEKYYHEADIVIAPVADGGGMKVKTVEAFTYGKCFVSTSESLNGYWEYVSETVKNHTVYKCDSPEEWTQVLNKLLGSQVKRFNSDVYQVFLDDFSYPVMREKFRQELKRVEQR